MASVFSETLLLRLKPTSLSWCGYFRIATLANSAQVLGSKDAREIPAIEGRARYQFGTKSVDIQAPFLTDEQLKFKLKAITEIRAQFISTTKKIAMEPPALVLKDTKIEEVHE